MEFLTTFYSSLRYGSAIFVMHPFRLLRQLILADTPRLDSLLGVSRIRCQPLAWLGDSVDQHSAFSIQLSDIRMYFCTIGGIRDRIPIEIQLRRYSAPLINTLEKYHCIPALSLFRFLTFSLTNHQSAFHPHSIQYTITSWPLERTRFAIVSSWSGVSFVICALGDVLSRE